MNSVIKKLFTARQMIANISLKKEGHNDYSNYNYFTPSQVNSVIQHICNELQLFTKFILIEEDSKFIAYLHIFDLEDENSVEIYQMPAAMPEIKATNAVQKIGGAMTFCERYLKMTAFGIVENKLDPDSQDNRPKIKPVMQPTYKGWDKAKEALKKGDISLDKLKEKYTLSKENEVLILQN